MKLKLPGLLSFALVMGMVQQIALAGPAIRLGDAISLMNRGKLKEATNALAAIQKGDPEYGAAQCYNALCLYELKDPLRFLNAMSSPVIRDTVIPPQVREDLEAKHIEALFQYRKFEDLLSEADAFKKGHSGSSQLNKVEEYRLATLFERGLKKTIEACRSKDTNVFNVRWPEGRTNLEAFRLAAGSLTNYSHVPNRVLQEDIWVARMALGDEQAVLAEIPPNDAAARERASFLRIQLYFKLQPEKMDRNLELMKDFVKQFPASKHRRRVEFDSATFSFRRGKQLWLEAKLAEQAGDSGAAAAKRSAANNYFELQQSLQGRLAVDKESGIEPSDMFDQREDLLTSYLFQKRFSEASTMVSALLAEATPGDMNWLLAKLNDGIALQIRAEPSAKEGAAIFDEVLAQGFKGRPDHDHLIIEAVRWRLSVALKSNDLEKAREITLKVRDGNCSKSLKAEFMKDNAWILDSKNAVKKEN